MSNSKKVIAGTIVLLIGVFFVFDLGRFLELGVLKDHQANLAALIEQNLLVSLSLFFVIYVTVTALSLPGAAVMTLAGGALLGFGWGLLVISFASTIGATLAFLVARFLFRDTLRKRYAGYLKKIDDGIQRDGAFYLATLRLIPVFPFFVINIVLGLTGMKTWTFYWVSQLAMLPGTAVFVNAGTQLAQIESMGDIISPELLLSFVLLGVFPLIARFVVGRIQKKRLYADFPKPERFDYNMVVIGGGSAGLVSAYIGATVNAKVALVERGKMGGDCLNTGCVPSKALIRSGRVAQMMRQADRYGLEASEPKVPFASVMKRIHSVIRTIEPNDSVERFTSLGVDCIQGSARFVTPWEIELDENGAKRRITTRTVVIATGGKPFVPPIPGIEEVEPLTSENLWEIEEQPGRLVVLGGGPIGSELSQAFARLGTHVTQIEQGDRLLPREDTDVSELVLNRFREEGVDVRLGHKASRFAVEDGERVVYCEHGGETVRIPFDRVLVAVGRKGNTEGLGLEALNIEPGPQGTVPTSDDLSVIYPNIFACGDVAGPYQFTHMAAHQAWHAAVNALFGQFKRFSVDYSVTPWVTFTSPEVGRVGLSEAEAREQGIDYEVTTYGLDGLDRAIAESEDHGFIRVITRRGKDKILGATVAGEHGGELLTEFILAMKHGIGLNKILGTIHPYPTWNESVKFTAGEWKKAHAPQKVIQWLGHYHRYRL
ncbi:pyridine nucleotide-disulfide oxidoreductase [Halovibrio salipaludis]|uniref:Pyridine nucleotide-disulfide oxidoreductase n=1 Tax=Halovibrio salipaludis TaxID=2032626 RepID=A0A2A2F8V5_9GAMM|nr:bifunctional TVP38/TMEM64 family protein/FAD-dependent oxidoreductase [Halovibrio salipaludis]PAU81951.1 pyridine nucleotide-disulfide oxidoreductase [Halovibrio salipaludis]